MIGNLLVKSTYVIGAIVVFGIIFYKINKLNKQTENEIQKTNRE